MKKLHCLAKSTFYMLLSIEARQGVKLKKNFIS